MPKHWKLSICQKKSLVENTRAAILERIDNIIALGADKWIWVGTL